MTIQRSPNRPAELRQVSAASDLSDAIAVLGKAPDGCLVCDTPNPKQLFLRFGKWHWQCGGCGLVFIHDIYPEFISDVEPEIILDEILNTAPRKKELLQWRATLAEFEGYRSNNRLLDLGCAKGNFLKLIKEAGWQEHGVETVPVLAKHCSETLGLNAFSGDLISAAFPEDHFDVIHMSEVIEHVINPVELLTEVHRVLRPGGLAFFRTGNVKSWSARVRGPEWPYFRFSAGDHIRFYGPKSTRALGETVGFAKSTTSTRGFAFREGGELKGHWYKLPVKLTQGPISILAGWCGAGHRLTMRFTKG
ncbi:MAG: 2-polyprenyl-3-methyl-5-hydroxy-6-metoxy-1,4-benzoquinol methylase [Planctomycetota bacterium]|jgi:2-polyprenyl-3-methyl-5-hydroxy-6-metoxy-1,4-benzoquinol methylase